MARLAAKRSTPGDSDDEPALRASDTRRHVNRLRSVTPLSEQSTSPTAAFSSDKENSTSRNTRGKSRMSALGERSMPNQRSDSRKRRRVGERNSQRNSVVPDDDGDGDNDEEGEDGTERETLAREDLKQALDDITDTRIYDPEQPAAVRRRLRMELGELSKNMVDNKNEYLQSNNTGITDTLRKANKLFSNIKQTADATLDSRLLVTAGDISAKRAVQNKYGSSEMGVDVDEFVTKCATFMRRGPTEDEAHLVTGTQRRGAVLDGDSDDESQEQDVGDELNWSWLGLKIAFQHNIRPPVPGFLLGPLSVQKKARKQTQRIARQQRRNPADALRPDELKADQIERQENANLTALCAKIDKLLYSFVSTRKEAIEKQIEDEDLSEEQAYALLREARVTEDNGACLFNFAFNPKSFGQTVENLFYISFLIRDGKAGIVLDHDGLPGLVPDPGDRIMDESEMTEEQILEKAKAEEVRSRNATKHQSVFHLDFDEWRDIVKAFDIKECVIPHRTEDGGRELGASGWYG